MGKFHFKARWRGLRVTRPGNKGDIVFVNFRHQTSSEKDAEILRGVNGVFEMPVEPVVEAPDKAVVVPKEEKKPEPRRGRRKG